MAPEAGEPSSEFPWTDKLDQLIRRSLGEFLKQKELNFKLTELMKMIELRHKLTPGGADQKRFWKMVEEIRQGADDKKPTGRPSQGKTTARRKKKK